MFKNEIIDIFIKAKDTLKCNVIYNQNDDKCIECENNEFRLIWCGSKNMFVKWLKGKAYWFELEPIKEIRKLYNEL